MSDHAAFGVVVITVLSLATSIIWVLHINDFGDTRFKRVGLATQLILGITFWLWGPWLFYGVTTLHTWNLGKINDLSRPEQVTPPTPITRPSAAEKAIE